MYFVIHSLTELQKDVIFALLSLLGRVHKVCVQNISCMQTQIFVWQNNWQIVLLLITRHCGLDVTVKHALTIYYTTSVLTGNFVKNMLILFIYWSRCHKNKYVRIMKWTFKNSFFAWMFPITLQKLLEYPTTTGFQWGLLKNGPYTYTASGENGRVF